MRLQHTSLSIQTFSDLIEGDFIYVDKTTLIYEMIKPSKAAYFFSRPRRFGKSLTISTLDAIFSGKNLHYLWCSSWIRRRSFGIYLPYGTAIPMVRRWHGGGTGSMMSGLGDIMLPK